MRLLTRKKQNEAYKLLAELYHLCKPEDIIEELDKYEELFELILDVAYVVGGIDGMCKTHVAIREIQNEKTEQNSKKAD